MKCLSKWYNRKFLQKSMTTLSVHGSLHTKFGYRSKWNPLRFLLGPIHYKIIHPATITCVCDWTNTQKTDIWDRYGRDK